MPLKKWFLMRPPKPCILYNNPLIKTSLFLLYYDFQFWYLVIFQTHSNLENKTPKIQK